jgi:hypothetical protein
MRVLLGWVVDEGEQSIVELCEFECGGRCFHVDFFGGGWKMKIVPGSWGGGGGVVEHGLKGDDRGPVKGRSIDRSN